MKSTVSIMLAFLLGRLAFGQINDQQAIAMARPFLAVLAPGALSTPPQVFRQTMADAARGPFEVIHVGFEEAVVYLDSFGQFQGFVNLSREAQQPRGGAPDKYVSDDAAWNALDAILTHFDAPQNLLRTRLVRESGAGKPYAMQYTMGPRPNGFEADGGNQVTAAMHRITGRVLAISMTRGWTYEPPNIRVTAESAIATARVVYGGSVQDWQAILKYCTVAKPDAPAYTRALHANKTMRLYYDVWSDRGNATVDSVTGEIVDFNSRNLVARADAPKTHDASARAPGNAPQAGSDNSFKGQPGALAKGQGKANGESNMPGKSKWTTSATIALMTVIAIVIVGSIVLLRHRLII